MADWKINGNTIPTPLSNGLTFKPEKIWDEEAGRVATGRFVGRLVTIKNTAQIQWPPLTPAQVAQLDAYFSLPSVNITYPDPRKGNSATTVEVYSGTPTYPVYSWAPGINWYVGVAVDVIEI